MHRFLSILALILLAGAPAAAQTSPQARVEAYVAALSTGDPAAFEALAQ